MAQKKYLCGCAAILALLLLDACSLLPRQPAASSFTSMGTLATITVAPEFRERLPRLALDIRAAFRKLENQLSTYQSDSEISRLARAAGISRLAISEDTFRILELSRHYGELTHGAFDVTITPLVRLWGFGGVAPLNPPEPQEIEEQLKLVGFRRIELQSGSAFLPSGMSVDLGGIGKGYAVDIAYEMVLRSGVKAAMADLGGNIRVLGQAEAGENWTIGVRNPFERERMLGKIALPAGMAVATSGNYERFAAMGGRRYSHIIDPRTGYPVEGMAGVTVIAPDATMSDALSTGLFVLGSKAGLEVLESLPGTEAMFIPDRTPMEIRLTPGMAKLFIPLPELKSSVRILPGLVP